MELHYKEKTTREKIIEETKSTSINLVHNEGNNSSNIIIKGENLQVMKTLLQKEYNLKKSIDLVYIDPPFSTNADYKFNHKRTSTISSSKDDFIAYSDKLKDCDYIEFLRKRLIFIYELMSDTASIYVHIDYKIGHYVKIIMDEIFGKSNFRNDITRIKCNPKNFSRKGYSNVKDMILFYTKSKNFVWNEPTENFSQKDIERLFPKIDKNGNRYTTTPLHAPGETKNGDTGKEWKGLMPPRGRHWRYSPSVLDELDKTGLIEWSNNGNPRKIIYAEESKKKGKRLQDIWEFKDEQYPIYPTQKNIEMLKTIIKTSSNKGQIVFDCFCGSGTTLIAAQELDRYWIGIDNSDIAIDICLKRLMKDKKEDSLFNFVNYNYYEQNNKVIN